ncbi:unnamed protein product [Polarella glacialis]|uniref:Uncharacterized protein n=1 Tax=Polarella glacialis TaxID=89957 RepID=A0A813KTV0_POLGL|nr:unnamed protein product [Polarella glacialis]
MPMLCSSHICLFPLFCRCVLQIAVLCAITLVRWIAIQPATLTIASRVEFGMGACSRDMALFHSMQSGLLLFPGYCSERLRVKMLPAIIFFSTSVQSIFTSKNAFQRHSVDSTVDQHIERNARRLCCHARSDASCLGCTPARLARVVATHTDWQRESKFGKAD